MRTPRTKLRKFVLIASVILVQAILMLGTFVRPVFGSSGTHISGHIDTDTVWTLEASPYILDNQVFVDEGVTLTIEPGVEVLPAPQPPDNYVSKDILVYGSLIMRGTPDQRITLRGTDQVHVLFGGYVDMAYTDFLDRPQLVLTRSSASVASSTFSRTNGACMYVVASKLDVSASRLDDCGVHGVFVSNSNVGVSRVNIRSSAFVDISRNAILNLSSATVHAGNNWWGTPDGPPSSGPGAVVGPIVYQPWLTSEPDHAKDNPCCSSVLFIPGLQGTRLHLSDNRLWEPNRNADMQKLFLTTAGSSTDPAIYSDEPIDRAYGLKSIYGEFMDFMDSVVSEGKINEWRSFGYDWRRPITEVVNASEKRATTTENLVETVEQLATRSRTGKVSIIAHSNGGLVAKYLVKTLADMSKAGLVDAVISVAVPYLGTPMAIGGLLHGEGQSILGGLVVSKANAQKLAINMPSAYSLLPSAKYFSEILSPTVVQASTSVSTPEGQSAFLESKGVNLSLLQSSKFLHGVLDVYDWPAAIKRWAIVGWNKETLKGLKYLSPDKRESIPTNIGDGTVMARSASYGAGQSISIDLKEQSSNREIISHANILESSTTKNTINQIITNPADNDAKIIEEIAKLPGVTIGELDWVRLDAEYEASRKQLRVSTHSPVNLHVYDQQGRHTGVIPLPDGMDEDIEPGFLINTEEGIPGSSLDLQGEFDSPVTYITLPDNGEKYDIVVEGVGIGTFKLEIERIRATSTIETISWQDVPVTPLTVASTTVVGNDSFVVPTDARLISSTTPLAVDLDSDGTTDMVLKVGKVRDLGPRSEIIKKILERLDDRAQAAVARLRYLW